MGDVIVVDTSEFSTSFMLDKNAWRMTLAASAAGLITLLVPEVVLLEADRQYKEAIQKERSRVMSRRPDELGVAILDRAERLAALDEAADRYLDMVRDKLLNSDAIILPIPDIPHSVVVQRDLAERKPFSRDGSGYRDFLIWNSIVKFLNSELLPLKVRLVTRNTKDFTDGGETLHSDYLDDMADGLVTSHQITIENGLPSLQADLTRLLETTNAPEGSTGDPLRDAIRSAVAGAAGNSPFVGALSDEELHAVGLSYAVRDGVEDLDVDSLEVDEETVEFTPYERMEGDTQLITASVAADLYLSGFIDKSDYYHSHGDYAVYDPDWNDHVMEVGVSTRCRLNFNVTVVGSSVEDISFDFAEPV